ncbi:MAG: hypothetical protein KatS3mg005_1710 [Bryobacteraceae bacterium]|nr:MAG: hypothetical protein KatS3mg005_1710 [Bryobacteraceae bacterium]
MNVRPLAKSSAQHVGGSPAAARRSYALEQITEYLRGFELGRVVDLGGACQNNIDYVTGMGHRLYAEEALEAASFQPKNGAPEEGGALPPGWLEFPRASVHAVFCWDRLQFLPEAVSEALVERMHRALAPGGLVLALFYPDQGTRAPLACRIADGSSLQIQPAGAARLYRAYSTRAIEKLFQSFESLKFYLTRESLQEVIVRR